MNPRVLAYATLMVLLVGLSGCSNQGTDFFDISSGDDFQAVMAKFQAQGYQPEGRDERPYIFTPDDFEGYYTFTDKTVLLAELRELFQGLQARDRGYVMQESVFLDTYLLRRSMDDAEAGFSCSAFDGTLLYAYCFIPNIMPVLDHYRDNYEVLGPFLVDDDGGGYSFWYVEVGDEAMIIDTGNDPAVDPYGGIVVFYGDNIKAFYAQMRAQLALGE